MSSPAIVLTSEEKIARLTSLVKQKDPEIRKLLRELMERKTTIVNINWKIKFGIGRIKDGVENNWPTIQMADWEIVSLIPTRGELVIAQVSIWYKRDNPDNPYHFSLYSPFVRREEQRIEIPIDDRDELASAIDRVSQLTVYIRPQTKG